MFRNIFGVLSVFTFMVVVAFPLAVILGIFTLGAIGYILMNFGFIGALLSILFAFSVFIWWVGNRY